MLQTSLLLMKSLNKTDSHFLSVLRSLFPKAIFQTFICFANMQKDKSEQTV